MNFRNSNYAAKSIKIYPSFLLGSLVFLPTATDELQAHFSCFFPQPQSCHVHVAIELHLFPTPQESWKTFHHKRLGLEQKGGVDT